MRIKIGLDGLFADLTDGIGERCIPRECWMLIPRSVRDVSGLVEYILHYWGFSNVPSEWQIYLDDLLVPPREAIDILRDGDFIRLMYDYGANQCKSVSPTSTTQTKKRRLLAYDKSSQLSPTVTDRSDIQSTIDLNIPRELSEGLSVTNTSTDPSVKQQGGCSISGIKDGLINKLSLCQLPQAVCGNDLPFNDSNHRYSVSSQSIKTKNKLNHSVVSTMTENCLPHYIDETKDATVINESKKKLKKNKISPGHPLICQLAAPISVDAEGKDTRRSKAKRKRTRVRNAPSEKSIIGAFMSDSTQNTPKSTAHRNSVSTESTVGGCSSRQETSKQLLQMSASTLHNEDMSANNSSRMKGVNVKKMVKSNKREVRGSIHSVTSLSKQFDLSDDSSTSSSDEDLQLPIEPTKLPPCPTSWRPPLTQWLSYMSCELPLWIRYQQGLLTNGCPEITQPKIGFIERCDDTNILHIITKDENESSLTSSYKRSKLHIDSIMGVQLPAAGDVKLSEPTDSYNASSIKEAIVANVITDKALVDTPTGVSLLHVSTADKTRAALRRQIDHYFSEKNYSRDSYLKSNEDPEGWIPFTVITRFNRVKALTSDIQVIKDSVRGGCSNFEVSTDELSLRHRYKSYEDEHTVVAGDRCVGEDEHTVVAGDRCVGQEDHTIVTGNRCVGEEDKLCDLTASAECATTTTNNITMWQAKPPTRSYEAVYTNFCADATNKNIKPYTLKP